VAYGKGRPITPPMNKQEADAINQGRYSQYQPEALFTLPFSYSSKSYKDYGLQKPKVLIRRNQ